MSEPFLKKRFMLPVGQKQINLPTKKTILIVILTLAVLLRLAVLDHWSLWTDELYTVLVSDIASLTTTGTPTDQHPPFYYLLIQGIIQVGRTEFLLRLPSALGGITAVWLMWRIGRVLERPRLGLLAAMLLALSPLHIWYSREARMYGPATMMWAAAIYFYLSLWRKGRFFDVAGLSMSLLAGLYTAYPTLALVGGQLALLIPIWHHHERDRRRLMLWLLSQLIVVIGFLPWLPFLEQQLSTVSPFDWLGPARNLLGAGIVDPIAAFLALLGFESTLAGTMRLATLGGIVLVVLVWLSFLITVKRPRLRVRLQSRQLWLVVFILMVFLAVTLVGALPRGLSVRRQLLVFWLPIVLLAAWALLQLNRWLVASAILVISLLLGGWTAFGPAHEDWRGAAGYITERAGPADILFLPTTGLVAFEYYNYGATPYAGAYITQLEPEALPTDGRIWLVLNRHPALQSASNPLLVWFNEQGQLVEQRSYSRFIEVYEYRRK